MTDIDKLARELAAFAFDTGCNTTTHEQIRIDAARMGILEGMKLQRERDAEIAESEMVAADETGASDDYAYNIACDHIAAAIRSAL